MAMVFGVPVFSEIIDCGILQIGISNVHSS